MSPSSCRAGFLLSLSILIASAVVTPARAGQVEFSVETPSTSVRVEADGPADRVFLNGSFERLSEPGFPELPYRIVRVLLPQGHTVDDVSFAVSGREVLRRQVRLATAPDRVTGSGERSKVVDEQLATGETVRYLGTGYQRGYAVAGFAVFPLGVEDGALVLTPRIDVRISTRPGGPELATRIRHREGRREAARARALRGVVNPHAADAYVFDEVVVPAPRGGFQPTAAPALEGSAVDYVIITRDSLAAGFQELADFKTEKGVPTVVRTIEWIEASYRNGTDVQETIRNFVVDAYAKWGIRYVLLGGDTDIVPARLCFSIFHDGGRLLPVDLYYGGLDGDWNADHDATFGEHGVDEPDLYAEVYVSRLPVENAVDVTVITAKIKDYENGVEPTNPAKALFLAEMLFPEDWTLGAPFTLDGANLAEYVRVSSFGAPGLVTERLYENYPAYPGSIPETKSATLDSINAGFGNVIHIGHGFRFNISVGDASILNAEAAALSNGQKQGNFYLLNCTAVSILFDCLGEVLMRNPDGGAVSVIGANESAFPTTSVHYMFEYYQLVMQQQVPHLARAFALAREVRTPLALLDDNVHFWTHYINTLLGDAEMPVYSNEVRSLSVAHVGSVGLGTSPITVTVSDGGSPVDSAVVCLSKDDDDYQVGTTDVSGQVTLNFRAEDAGSIKVVVTGRNYARSETAITVGAGAPAYVSLAGCTVDDDNAGGTTGNGDGVVDAGETVDLWLTMANSGGSGSGNVDVVLRCADGAVTILDSTASVGPVAASASVAAADPVRVSFAASIGDGASIDFALGVRENSVEVWGDAFAQAVAAPVLSKVVLRVDDSAAGNGNGVVDPNEFFSLYYEVKNFGSGQMPSATANITDLDGGFVVTTSASPYAALASLASEENSSPFLLREPDTSVEHRLEIAITDLYGRTMLDTFELRPPVPTDSAFIDPSLDPNQLRVTWGLSASADARYYNVFRSATSGGPYTQVNIDPVAHGAFVDRGLALATEYFYMVTTIDASGNESAPSVEFSGSTNPPLLGGWPVTMEKESTSSPVVGDVDGDGDKELVTGDNRVYAWHADGYELIDGDNDALTWGVLSPLGDEYTSHIALARMDGKPGLDIIAASRNTQEVYIFNYLGQVLPGWPKSLQTTVRAGILAADINDDNIIEVVVVDELGTIYVFEPDGTEYRDGDNNPGTDGVFATLANTPFLHYCTPAAADIDGDGMREIIVGSQALTDSLFAFNEDGSQVPGFPVALTADISGAPAVGDVDGNGDLEIVVFDAAGQLRVFNHDGSVLWTRWFPANEGFFGPSPALADMTQNGRLEVFIPDKNGNLYAIDYTGADLPGWPVTYSTITYTESSPIVVDIDGDGGLDVILGSEDRYIWAWDQGGNVVAGFPVTTGDAMRSVLCADDLDLDGDVDLAATGWDRSVYVWDFSGPWTDGERSWNSFHGNAHNDGLVGSVIPTGVGAVSFDVEIRGERVELTWAVPVETGVVFDLSRARVDGGVTGAYRLLAPGLTTETTGVLRYADTSVRPGETYHYRLTSAERGEVDERSVYVPVVRAALAQNYPNPFNPATRIEYLVPDGGARRVRLVVYDVRGARVRTLVESLQPGGRYRVDWDGRDDRGQRVASGIYFYRLAQPGFTATRKMLMLK